MEKYSFIVALFFCTVFVHRALGFPFHDVSIACDSMLPDHGRAPQMTTPPYVISVSFDRYDPGNEIQVVLDALSPSGFQAFMVQAREVDGNVPVGMFRITDPNSQGLPCANISNSAVSHRNPFVKHRITTSWVAPQGTKQIRLMATFVQDPDNYWVGVHSKTLSPRHSDIANYSTTVNDSMTTNSSDIANDSMTTNSSDIANDLLTTNSSELANELLTYMASVPADSEAANDFNTLLADIQDTDFNTLLPDIEDDDFNNLLPDIEEDESEIPVDSEPIRDSRENVTGRSRRKSVLSVNVICGEGGVSQSSSDGCVKSAQGTSQSTGSQSKIIVKEKIVVKQGGSSGVGCVGGGVGSVYNQYGCKDSGSTNTGTKVKVVSYPDTEPFPPERDSSSSTIGGVIYSQGKKPQSGSSESIRITVQSGKGIPACDKSSPSYNVQICNQGQAPGSQAGSPSGTQQGGSYPSGSSACGQGTTSTNPCNPGQSPGSQAGSPSGMQQGGSYPSGSSACGQGTTSTNPCNPGQASSYNSQGSSSQSQGNIKACNQGKDGSYNNNRC